MVGLRGGGHAPRVLPQENKINSDALGSPQREVNGGQGGVADESLAGKHRKSPPTPRVLGMTGARFRHKGSPQTLGKEGVQRPQGTVPQQAQSQEMLRLKKSDNCGHPPYSPKMKTHAYRGQNKASP